ncbi:nucleolar protein 11-like isoform X2 [Amphiura filiformis]|uniref:nucleolar protein 11-like isoform X2 n=1 Tax=Amphiura filiformis TaxID=82378 RepID=UPI003B2248EF
MNQSAEQVIRVSIDSPSKLLHTSFHTTNSQMVMHAVGSDGDLYECSISHNELPQCKILSCQPVLKKLSSNRHAKQVKVASIGLSLVAVVGLEGEYTDHVCVWDTKYNILLAKQSLQSSTDRTRISVSNIIYASNHLWVSTNHGIHAFSVERAPSTLSVALGRQAAPEERSRFPVIGQQWRFDDQGEFEGDMETDDGNQAGDHGILQDILNKEKIKSAKQFKSAVYKLLSSKQLPVNHVDQATMLHSILKHVCDRCAEDKKFWPKEGLVDIVKTGLIAASSCTDFVSCVIERGDIDVLISCLQHMQDIPDSTLALVIDFILRDLSSDTDDSGKSDTPKRCPIAEDKAELIDLTLKCPMNDIFMLECIAKVKFQQVMVLLRYLYYRLNTTIADDEQTLPANVVIDWIMLILDAHYSQLVLSPEARVLLVNLNQIVETLSHYHDEVDAVHEMLSNLPSPITETPKAKPDAIYSIEVLKL